MELWFTEKQTDTQGISLLVKETLHREKTPYQELMVLDTFEYGRVLVLDGVIQTTERDEFTYHEMITHVALCSHPNPRRVMVVGGGDGGTIREILKHRTVEKAELVEIDERVIANSKRFLPSISVALDDPRCEIVVADGIEKVKQSKGQYDCIIVDSTDPVGPAVGLFKEDFYRAVFEALREDGLFVAQTESPFYNADLIREVFGVIRSIFPIARLYTGFVPTYPGGYWTFTVGSKKYDPRDGELHRTAELQTRYYTADVHRAAFVLPPFAAELIE